MKNDDPLVTIAHLRAANHCRAGAQQWFEAHGLDWRDFVRNGIPASKMDATGDAMAYGVTKIAREENGQG